jgi:hypothetical protein
MQLFMTVNIPIQSLLPMALALLVGCSHDSTRENPLDPELSPAVALQAALDDTAGTVTLT